MAFQLLAAKPVRWRTSPVLTQRPTLRARWRSFTLLHRARVWLTCLSVSGEPRPIGLVQQPTAAAAAPKVTSRNRRLLWAFAAVALVAVTLLVRRLWQQPWLHAWVASLVQRLLTLSDKYGVAQVTAALSALHLVAIVLCFPASALIEVAAGYALGFPLGFLSMHVSKVAAAVVCFALGRTILFGYVQRQSERFPRFRRWLDVVRREGPTMMLYMRLSPVPSFLNNYLLAAVGVRFTDFLWTTALGTIPGLLPLVGAGVGARDLSLLSIGAEGGLSKAAVPTWAHLLRLGSTLVGVILLIGLLVRLYRQRLESRAPVLKADHTDADAANENLDTEAGTTGL